MAIAKTRPSVVSTNAARATQVHACHIATICVADGPLSAAGKQRHGGGGGAVRTIGGPAQPSAIPVATRVAYPCAARASASPVALWANEKKAER
eukprot:5444244-Alexandrium_andersonii.AAC.1